MPRTKKQDADPIFELLGAVSRLIQDAHEVARAIERLKTSELSAVQRTHLNLIRQCVPDLSDLVQLLDGKRPAAARIPASQPSATAERATAKP